MKYSSLVIPENDEAPEEAGESGDDGDINSISLDVMVKVVEAGKGQQTPPAGTHGVEHLLESVCPHAQVPQAREIRSEVFGDARGRSLNQDSQILSSQRSPY